MNRRIFLKGAFAAGSAAPLSGLYGGAKQAQANSRPASASEFDRGVYAGSRYRAVVPDTLRLAKRAELGINGIGGTIDPALRYMMFFLVRYASKTPYMTTTPLTRRAIPNTRSRFRCSGSCAAAIVMPTLRQGNLPSFFPGSMTDFIGIGMIRLARGGLPITT